MMNKVLKKKFINISLSENLNVPINLREIKTKLTSIKNKQIENFKFNKHSIHQNCKIGHNLNNHG